VSYLDQAVTPALSEQAVRQTMFDDLLFSEMRLTSPALDNMVDSLACDYGYTDALVSDTFAALYQSAPLLRERREMIEDCVLHHAVAVNLARAPEVASLRGYTVHNKYYAAMGTTELANKVREYLREAESEVKDAALAAEQARQRADDADEQAQDQAGQVSANGEALDLLMQALDEAMGEFDGNGPLTEQQADAQQAVDDARDALALSQAMLDHLLDKAEAARAAAEAAEQVVQELADAAERATRTPVADAVHESVERIAQEVASFRAWGTDEAELERMPFAERAAQAKRMKNHRLKEWVNVLGRFKMLRVAEYAKKVAHARDEVYGVTFTGDLHDVLPSEFVHLATEPGRLQFLQQLSERKLLGRKYRGKDKVGQGALIVLMDTSSSMRRTDGLGCTREVFCKGLGLAMLDEARDQGRDFVGIIFGPAGKHEVWHFPKGRGSFDDVLDMTEKFMGGGTDFQVPIDLGVDILEQQFNDEHLAKGDLILLTDDDCAVTPKWLAQFQERKAKLGFRFYGVALGLPRPGGTLTTLSDDVRSITEFHDPSVVADIFRTV
jgi:uncharacterized protein with von Willebrand factor type A (vWA) domain